MTSSFLLVGLSALLLFSAFPAYYFWPAAFVAFIPFLQAIEGARNPKAAFKAGFVWGLFFFSVLLWWLVPTISTYGRIHFILAIPVVLCLCCYLALYPAIWSFCVKKLYASGNCGLMLVLPASCCWIVLEAIRSFLLSGFPWGLTAYTLSPVPVLIQSADLWGVYGVSFFILFFNTSVFEASRILRLYKNKTELRRSFVFLCAGVVFVLCFHFFYGLLKTRNIPSSSIQVAAVQAAIDQNRKWAPEITRFTVDTYIDLTQEAIKTYPNLKLVVWPETAMPFYFQENSAMKEQVLKFARKNGLYILLGSPSYTYSNNGQLQYLNSAYIIGPKGILLGRYDKNHLVPFGEYMPWGKLTSWARRFLPTAGDFVPGNKIEPLKAGPFKVGTMICFESIFPEIARIQVQTGANILAVITNDAWFGRTAAPYQHAEMAVFRAVENRRWLVRAANTGISRIISPSGQVMAESHLFKRQYITAEAGLNEKQTFYSRYGSFWFVAINFLVFLAAFFRLPQTKRVHK